MGIGMPAKSFIIEADNEGGCEFEGDASKLPGACTKEEFDAFLFRDYAIKGYNQLTRNGVAIFNKDDPDLCPDPFSQLRFHMPMPGWDNTEIVLFVGKLDVETLQWLKKRFRNGGGVMMTPAQIMRHVYPHR